LGPLAVDSLWGALKVLESADGLQALAAASPPDADGDNDWNRALMVFIPKKLPQQQGTITYHDPGDTRPLSIVNTDNRLLANAVRLRVEPLLAKGVSEMQRGFLPHRSMLQNVIEVDAEMRLASLDSDTAAAIFFDFAAAFPSLAHDFLHEVLRHLNLPESFCNFVRSFMWATAASLHSLAPKLEVSLSGPASAKVVLFPLYFLLYAGTCC
jgi:hypothetical protein